MRPDLASLALFIRIAETKSITKAAEACHIALAAASRRVTLLEDRFGVQLLYRTARGVELTPAGDALLFHARRMMAQVDQMRAEISDYSKGLKGLVRVHANASALAQYLPDDLASFAVAHPAIGISLAEERSSAIVAALQSGATDVGIVMEGAEGSEGMQMFGYRTDVLCVVVPRNHPLRERSLPFAKLLDQDFVGLESSTVISQILLAQAQQADKPLRLKVEVKSFDVVARLVQAGLGLGVLPEDAARAFAGHMGLRLVRLTDAWASRRMFVAVRQYATLPAPARQLVDHLLGAPPEPPHA